MPGITLSAENTAINKADRTSKLQDWKDHQQLEAPSAARSSFSSYRGAEFNFQSSSFWPGYSWFLFSNSCWSTLSLSKIQLSEKASSLVCNSRQRSPTSLPLITQQSPQCQGLDFTENKTGDIQLLVSGTVCVCSVFYVHKFATDSFKTEFAFPKPADSWELALLPFSQAN